MASVELIARPLWKKLLRAPANYRRMRAWGIGVRSTLGLVWMTIRWK
jgi:hypothetical protein